MTSGSPADGPAPASQAASYLDRRASRGQGGATAPRPLTHHEILGLVEPFARRGRHVDLSASDRMERRLVFKPIAHAGETFGPAGASEILQLENPRAEVYRLIRTLTLEGGAKAKLTTEGLNPGELLARIETVPPERQVQSVAGVPIARSYRLEAASGDATKPLRMALTSAEARLDGVTLVLKAETGRGYPAEIELTPQPDHPLDLPDGMPDDLLATLGWDWRVLGRRGTGWTSALRAPRNEPRRSRRIEVALEQAVAHLARTLSEPPRRFHERLVRARWGVVFRRMLPLIVSIALIGAAVGLTFVDIAQDSLLRMLILNSPPLLLVMVFTMRELPRFEIPPPPRPSRAPSWFSRKDGGEGPAQQINLK